MAAAPDEPTERLVRVVHHNGAPAGDALVSIVASSVPMPELALLTGPDGTLRLRLPAGRFTLRAHAGDATGDVEVDGAPADDDIVIVTA